MRTHKEISSQQQNEIRVPERMLGKRLPAAIEAEKALLGALLLNDENVSHVTEILTSKDFYIPAHRHVYEAIVTIFDRSERVDIITLQNELEKKGVVHVSIQTKQAIPEYLSTHYEIKVGSQPVAYIYKPLACHSYNTIKLNDKIFRVATIDTMLSFYLLFLYANKFASLTIENTDILILNYYYSLFIK